MTINIAVQGCCHGELDAIYQSILEAEGRTGKKVDLLLICGDMESVRWEGDLDNMAVPAKYRAMNTFHEYLLGIKVAPVLTVFIGGNHEASNVLQDLFHGGYVAPKIYFLGYGAVVRFKGLRIAGLSGIFDKHHYHQGHYEHPPYNPNSLRSVYHYRRAEIERFLKWPSNNYPVDIFLSHDWPSKIVYHGDVDSLQRIKPYFREEIARGELGSSALDEILQSVRPKCWFAAHLHVKYPAVFVHPPREGEREEVRSSDVTRFLALDKVLPRRSFLHFLSIPENTNASSTDEPVQRNLCGFYDDDDLHFDLVHLASLRSGRQADARDGLTSNDAAIRQTAEMVCKVYGERLVVPSMHPIVDTAVYHAHVRARGNLQTDRLLQALGQPHVPPFTVPLGNKHLARGIYDSLIEEENADSSHQEACTNDPNALDI
eukprot:gene2312-2533_t